MGVTGQLATVDPVITAYASIIRRAERTWTAVSEEELNDVENSARETVSQRGLLWLRRTIRVHLLGVPGIVRFTIRQKGTGINGLVCRLANGNSPAHWPIMPKRPG